MGNFDLGWLQEHLETIVVTFVIAQLVILAIAWHNLSKRASWHTHTNTWASILTVIGIFGTFFGIFIGLQAFKIENIEGSIPDLLEGLKLAFLTSLLGILSAIILKWKGLYQTQKADDLGDQTIDKFVTVLTNTLKDVETSGESNLSSKLETLTEAVEKVGAENRSILDKIKSGIADGQNDLLKQLQTLTNTVFDKSDLIINSQKNEAAATRKTLTDMQSELTDRQGNAFRQLRTLTKTVSYEHNQLRKEFGTFSKNVAESITELATKELISSLTTVIENFNTQLSTQFGENFKQLNEAVGKTIDWQKQYRQQMDKLANEFQIAAASIDKSRDSLKNIADSSNTIADRSSSIVDSAEKLEPILHTLNDQLGAFSDLRQKANEAFPIIEERLEDLTTKFSGAVQKTITDSREQSTKLADQYDEFQKVIGGLDDFTSKIDKVTTDVSDIVKDLKAIIDSQAEALRNSASYVTTMQTKLDEQLTESIGKLGTNLASLSDKFVEDYIPLTHSLREVLTIAGGILPKQPGN